MSFVSTSSKAECKSSSICSASSNGIPIVKTYKKRRTLPELLAIRQAYGTSAAAGRHANVPSSLLSYSAAWNPSRLQNMILSVGPGTPANVLRVDALSSSSVSLASSSQASSVDRDNEDEESKMEEDEEEEEGNQSLARSRWTRRERDEEDEEADDDLGDNEEDEDGNSDDDNSYQDALRIVESTVLEWYAEDSLGYEEEVQAGNISSSRSPVPSMRHGGCINTAAWLDCGWRLSTTGASYDAVFSEDCPTQLVTSGDDHLVKFWDVSHAMGMKSPLPGSHTTICPFSAPNYMDQDHTRKSWKKHYAQSKSQYVAGSVLPLATLNTGHRGNIFHVTPLIKQPGKVATCGADGFLRVTDLESGNASIVVSPDEDDVGRMLHQLRLRPEMCFSHHFLNQNTGLLCSEGGLRSFDLRLPPREQPTRSLFGGTYRACKACAIWSSPTSVSSLEEGDSVYVFAGGPSADVAFCDLRMTGGSSSRVIQRYRPSGLATAEHVSVSGLDLSRDKKELLVSYESDQIYTFPVFPEIQSPLGPTLDQLCELRDNADGGSVKVLNELAAYGAHLNRFTFLKNARYAGPQDEYICTGSDSGHAWIYEKSNGSVVSFLNADNSTCNGVVPHPSLPVFITYGIDSTAKLWRGTTAVDLDVDDSPAGRLKCYRETEYEMSPTVRKWGEVQQVLDILDAEDCIETDILPDHIPRTKNLMRDGRRVTRIGNDLHNLPGYLKQNLYVCLRSLIDDDDVPVENDIESLKHRISLIRLRHQADRLGILWNPLIPWALQMKKKEVVGNSMDGVHPSDLVPDAPSDWMPYDPNFCKSPWNFNDYFNKKEYRDFYMERYESLKYQLERSDEGFAESGTWVSTESEDNGMPECSKEHMADSTEASTIQVLCSSSEEGDDKYLKHSFPDILLYETMLALKDGGNLALHAGSFDLAARRYDKAIQYGAVAIMSFPVKGLDYALDQKESGYSYFAWRPIVKVLTIVRLNLALLMLKPHFSKPDHALEQAQLALLALKPFCVTKGKVINGLKLDEVQREDEPEETFFEALALEAKAYFRLGSAQYKLAEYSKAILSFEHSVRSSQRANSKPDNLVLRRLSEAKRQKQRISKKNHRKKLKLAFRTESQRNMRAEEDC